MTRRTLSRSRGLAVALALLAAPGALAGGAHAQAAAPEVAVLGTPTLHVATPQPARPDASVAWVTFRTRRHVDARLTVVRVDGRSGRSFAASGATDCIRSTRVEADGRGALRAGERYVVEVFARAGIGSRRPRTLVAKRTLTARAFVVGPGRSTPTCTTGAPRSPFTPAAAFRKGVRAFARFEDATVRSVSVSCRPIPRVGDVARCTGAFRVRRAGRTATYVLTDRASTFRNSPGSIEYRIHARTGDSVPGLPRSVGGLLGFLQSGGA